MTKQSTSLPGQRWWKRVLWRLYQPKGLVRIQGYMANGENWIQLDYRNGLRIAGVLDPQLKPAMAQGNPFLEGE